MRICEPILFPSIFLISSLATILSATADEAIIACSNLPSAELNKLNEVFAIGDIKVFYTKTAPLSGLDHRPYSLADANANGHPDFVENVARQADAARKAFIFLGFRDPLDSARYRAVEKIHINILSIAGNGVAYDRATSQSPAPNRGTTCSLNIDISSQLEAGAPLTTNWFVVSHEVFHLFQYGATLYKRSWVNEATAKWAEYALRSGPYYPQSTPITPLPDTTVEMQPDIICNPTSATANRLFSRLIEVVDAGAGK